MPPMHMFNTDQLNRLTKRLGMIRHVMPFGLQARQMEHITVYVETNHQRRIPKWLRVEEGEFEGRIHIKLLAWRVEQLGFFPLTPDANPPGLPVRTRMSARRAPRLNQQRCNPPPHREPNISLYFGKSSTDLNDHQWVAAPIAGQVRLNHNKPKKVMVPKPAVLPVRLAHKNGEKAWVPKPKAILTRNRGVPEMRCTIFFNGERVEGSIASMAELGTTQVIVPASLRSVVATNVVDETERKKGFITTGTTQMATQHGPLLIWGCSVAEGVLLCVGQVSFFKFTLTPPTKLWAGNDLITIEQQAGGMDCSEPINCRKVGPS